MHILYNPQGNTEGHAQQYATNIANGLIDAGCTVGMVTSRDFDPTFISSPSSLHLFYTDIDDTRSVKKDDRGVIGRLRYGLTIIKNNVVSFKSLTRVINKREFDHISIIGGDTLSNLFFILLNRGLDKSKCSITIHNADYDLSLYRGDAVRLVFKWLSRLVLKQLTKTDLVIFTHGEVMSELLAKQLACSIDRISFYRVPAAFSGDVKVKSINHNAPVKLLFIGVMRHDKGLEFLCNSLAKLVSKARFELTVAGSAAQVGEAYVSTLVESSGLSDTTTLDLRYLSDEEMEDYILRADITVLPYRKTFLAKSVVMSDTARLGTPAIATEQSQNGFDVKSFNVGWCFESENTEDLTKVLEEAISEVSRGTTDFGFDRYIDAHLPASVGLQILEAMGRARG